jgi:hypothetical protein
MGLYKYIPLSFIRKIEAPTFSGDSIVTCNLLIFIYKYLVTNGLYNIVRVEGREFVASPSPSPTQRENTNALTSTLVKVFRHLKVAKCEIFDRSDFDDFYTIKSLCEGDFGVKIKKKF